MKLFSLFLLICCLSCSQPKQDVSPPKDQFDEKAYQYLPSDSLRAIIDGLKDNSYVGRPIGEFLMDWNPKKYRVGNVYFTNAQVQYYEAISFEIPGGIDVKINIHEEDKINADEDNRFQLNILNAEEIKDLRVGSYEVTYLGNKKDWEHAIHLIDSARKKDQAEAKAQHRYPQFSPYKIDEAMIMRTILVKVE